MDQVTKALGRVQRLGRFLPHAARYAMEAHNAARANGQLWTELKQELQELVEASMRVTATATAAVARYTLEEDPEEVGEELLGMLGRLDDLDEWVGDYHGMLEETRSSSRTSGF